MSRDQISGGGGGIHNSKRSTGGYHSQDKQMRHPSRQSPSSQPMNKVSSDFFCCRDNQFSHYMYQRLRVVQHDNEHQQQQQQHTHQQSLSQLQQQLDLQEMNFHSSDDKHSHSYHLANDLRRNKSVSNLVNNLISPLQALETATTRPSNLSSYQCLPLPSISRLSSIHNILIPPAYDNSLSIEHPPPPLPPPPNTVSYSTFQRSAEAMIAFPQFRRVKAMSQMNLSPNSSGKKQRKQSMLGRANMSLLKKIVTTNQEDSHKTSETIPSIHSRSGGAIANNLQQLTNESSLTEQRYRKQYSSHAMSILDDISSIPKSSKHVSKSFQLSSYLRPGNHSKATESTSQPSLNFQTLRTTANTPSQLRLKTVTQFKTPLSSIYQSIINSKPAVTATESAESLDVTPTGVVSTSTASFDPLIRSPKKTSLKIITPSIQSLDNEVVGGGGGVEQKAVPLRMKAFQRAVSMISYSHLFSSLLPTSITTPQVTLSPSIQSPIKDNTKQKNDLQRQEVISYKIIEAYWHFKQLLFNDQLLRQTIKDFCNMDVEQFCFCFAGFFDSVVAVKSIQTPSTFSCSSSKKSVPITTEQQIAETTDQTMTRKAIKLPLPAIKHLKAIVKASLIAVGMDDTKTEQILARFSVRANSELLPDTLLEELGGREFISRIFYDFTQRLIHSQEFLRDKYEDQYAAILKTARTDDARWITVICQFLNTPNAGSYTRNHKQGEYLLDAEDDGEPTSSSLEICSDEPTGKPLNMKLIERQQQEERTLRTAIRGMVSSSISSIDFLVLKKWVYRYMIEQCGQKRSLVLRVVSRVNELRRDVCDDGVFITNPENFQRHIFLTVKNLISSSAFLKTSTHSHIASVTESLVSYITQESTVGEFLDVLKSTLKHPEDHIDLLELALTQACEIYTTQSHEDRANIQQRFDTLRVRLKQRHHVFDGLPDTVHSILLHLQDWVKTKITEVPLPREILLKDLSDTELLELLMEFSQPGVEAFDYHDAFAAFSFFKINLLHFEFWMQGLTDVLSINYRLGQEQTQGIINFLHSFLPFQQQQQHKRKSQNVIHQSYVSAARQVHQ